MIFLLAPDSFKESMTAQQACDAMERGILKNIPGAACMKVPMADGGEGTMQTLLAGIGGRVFKMQVTGPLGNPVMAEYAISADGKTGLVELASASGLHLVPPDKRNPLITTTYGTGELIKKLIEQGVQKLIIGIGGSATNDGGTGVARALGVKFLDEDGKEIGYGGGELSRLATIDTSGLITKGLQLLTEVACDVNNPLTGEYGASKVYGPQKGASPEEAAMLDENLKHYATVIRRQMDLHISDTPGAGAAGGTGAGLMAFMNARLVKGIKLIMEHLQVEEKVKQADFIFTGEGSIDQQTIYGKTISGILDLAKKYNKPVIAFAGRVSGTEALYKAGITSIFGILPSLGSEEDALKNGPCNLENAAAAVARLIIFQKNL